MLDAVEARRTSTVSAEVLPPLPRITWNFDRSFAFCRSALSCGFAPSLLVARQIADAQRLIELCAYSQRPLCADQSVYRTTQSTVAFFLVLLAPACGLLDELNTGGGVNCIPGFVGSSTGGCLKLGV